MYVNMKMRTAEMEISLDVREMTSDMLSSSVSLDVNVLAIDPIIRAIDGIKIPPSMAAIVPNICMMFSFLVLYLKNLLMEIDLPSSSSSSWFPTW
jgi:hypothetical protein